MLVQGLAADLAFRSWALSLLCVPCSHLCLSPFQGRAEELRAAGGDVHLEVSENALLALQGNRLPTLGCQHIPASGPCTDSPFPIGVTLVRSSCQARS